MSKELLKNAKIGVGEFAKLAGVSRVTASLWSNGHAKPHMLHSARIERLYEAITEATKAGELPLTAKLTKTDKAVELTKVVNKYLGLLAE